VGPHDNSSYDNLKATVDKLLKQNEDFRARMEDIEQGQNYEEEDEEEV
ncbi:hypothetical protein A2U01_0117837, partial [Trifolium medium]|nr:hypothetical protein [Trifolium medium]